MSRGRRRDHDQASHRERPDERRANSSAGRRQVEAVQVQSQEPHVDTAVPGPVKEAQPISESARATGKFGVFEAGYVSPSVTAPPKLEEDGEQDSCPQDDTEAPSDSDYDPFAGDDNAAEEDRKPDSGEHDASREFGEKALPANGVRPDGDASAGQADVPFNYDEDDDDDGAFNILIELFRAAESHDTPEERPRASSASSVFMDAGMEAGRGHGGAADASSFDSRPASSEARSVPQHTGGLSRPLDSGEPAPKKPKRDVEYEYNPATQRWEPMEAKQKVAREASQVEGKAASRSNPVQATAPPDAAASKTRPCRNYAIGMCSFGARCRFLHSDREARGVPFAHHVQSQERARQAIPAVKRHQLVAECEREARMDVATGVCEHAQALAVRLALRFESRPADILSSMAEAGLPAAKDQRSTVKAIMRLCHPDKCKHPEAKRAMQILGPLLA